MLFTSNAHKPRRDGSPTLGRVVITTAWQERSGIAIVGSETSLRRTRVVATHALCSLTTVAPLGN